MKATGGRGEGCILFRILGSVVLLWLALSTGGGVLAADMATKGGLSEVTIGVLNIRSAPQTVEAWQPTADYLGRIIPDYRFRVVPLDAAQFGDAVNQGSLDFILTNPAHYVYLEAKHRISRIATLVKMWNGHPLKEFGGVVIVRADRWELRGFADLKGRRVAAAGLDWLGAYQAQAAEALAEGLDVREQVTLSFTGEPQDRVVVEVLEGRADAGFVRTGLLEEMRREGKLDVAGIRVLAPRQMPEFPLQLSTRLYPEWPFAVAPRTPTRLANRVAVALLGLAPDSEPARRGDYLGWSIPADYHRVHELMRTLELPPYDERPRFSLRDVLRRYDLPLFAGLALALLAAVAAVLRFRRLGSMLRLNMATVTQRTQELEGEVTARREAEQGLRLSASVFENANDGIVITDRDNRIVDVNNSFTAITGYSREEVLGKNPRILQSGRQDPVFYQELWKTLSGSGHWRGEIWNRRKSGEFYVELLDITAVRNAEGVVSHYVAVFSDITDLRNSQERLRLMAHYDPLTHLPNRALLADRLTQAAALADRDDHLLAVGFLDLDGFKPINDEYGHEIGDQLLISIARRLEAALRAIDTVARLGGDEFVLLLTNLADLEELETILARVMAAIEEKVVIDGIDIKVSASIGLTIYPIDDADPESLLRHADQAMYAAKRSGRSRYSLFDAGQDKEVETRIHRIESIRAALRNNEFRLYYQPKVDMRQGRIVGFEALIRWQHPQRGLVMPGEFLPLIEQTDLIVELDDWVIGAALRQIEIWLGLGLEAAISVNLSARRLQLPDFGSYVQQCMAAHPSVPARLLEFEILESAALGDLEGVRHLIRGCQDLGVTFSLDDFGTGYSSLSYLKRLPVDTIKIDQSFVRDLLDNAEDLAIVEGIVGLAKVFQRRVVGEGVETREHGVMLMRLGCDVAQGYGIARPMPAEAVPDWWRRFKPDPHWAEWANVHWNVDDFPLLVAQSDHVKWVKNLVRLVDGAAAHGPVEDVADHHGCRFGRWYYGSGKRRYGQIPEFAAIEPIHTEIHRIGSEIVELLRQGDVDTARQRLAALVELRNGVLDRLAGLQREVAGGYW
ncbi:MAG: EAL domain-containing protein [Sterolibacteriaceae bacterium MAG5]|nr:EAL domain-containing protein [Candidatus Nitricoxidireducens bremensis]